MNKSKTFGRIVKFDERSRKFAARTLTPNKPARSYTWTCPIQLDQKSEGACTGFSVAHEAAARPVQIKDVTEDIAFQIYRRAKQLDSWEGENYEGSSVIAAVKAGQERGWYNSYYWTFSEPELAVAVSRLGPVILGIDWLEGMEVPDSKGVIRAIGGLLGGHAILCIGYNIKTRMYKLHNSWGVSWGINGECYISAEDMSILLARQGEACVPIRNSAILSVIA